MSQRIILAVIALCLVTAADKASAQARNCPVAVDQLVLVNGAAATAFSLDVPNLGDGTVSIFQFPLGGTLEQTGPTSLDFVFVPDRRFNGTATFTYRLNLPQGCAQRSQLGTVTLAAAKFNGFPVVAPVHPGVCGVGFFAPAFAALSMLGFARRRSRAS